ncbi:MAG: M56 family metallopeptidase [Gemmatimonadaceae bacterium]
MLTFRRPVRGVWVAAILGANLLPIVLSQMPVLPLVKNWALNVAVDSLFAQFDTPLLILWGVAVAIGCFICVSAVWRMSRTRPLWKTEHVDDTPVLVSHDIGPALVGVMQYSIVVPQWAYSLETGARRLLLTHEREHARKYDPLLLAAAALAVVIAPWNVFNWLFFRRLHLAVELDCDQRVLRAHPDARVYAALLLDVAERVLPSVMPAAAFVEHGASLETRLNAMTEKKKPFRGVRASVALVASVTLTAAACVMPRPYAIVVVVPTSLAQATQTSTQAVEEKMQAREVQKSQRPIVPPFPASVGFPGVLDTRPVPPSARVTALDQVEQRRMRAAVIAAAPRALDSWSRRDSGLVLLFNDRGDVVKQSTVDLSGISLNLELGNTMSRIFLVPAIGALNGVAEASIRADARGQALEVPLRLFVGVLSPGAEIPLTRNEIVPAQETMIATLRSNHPELLRDTAGSPTIGALLLNSRGKIVKSAAVVMDFGPFRSDGSQNPEYDRQVMRKAFGTLLDSGAIVQNGTTILSNAPSFTAGPSKLLYAVIVMNKEWEALANKSNPVTPIRYSGSSSRGPSRLMDQRERDQILRSLVDSRIPDAFGDWSRADSAVLLLFDASEQLIARRTSPIPENAQLKYLSTLISRRVPGVDPEDFESVGSSMFESSSGGRVLDRPLTVVWGKLRRDVTFKPLK